jgi:hypothetical protein
MKARTLGWTLLLLALCAGSNSLLGADAETEWTGTVEKTQRGGARLTVGDKKYRLRPSETASDAVKETLKKIAAGDLTGTFVVKGKKSEGEGRPGRGEAKGGEAKGDGENKGEGEKKGEGEAKGGGEGKGGGRGGFGPSIAVDSIEQKKDGEKKDEAKKE